MPGWPTISPRLPLRYLRRIMAPVLWRVEALGDDALALLYEIIYPLYRLREVTMRYTFGDYTLDTHRYELCRAGIPLKLQPKVFDLLAYLIQHRDRVVTRQELFDILWPEQFV